MSLLLFYILMMYKMTFEMKVAIHNAMSGVILSQSPPTKSKEKQFTPQLRIMMCVP